MTAIATSAAIGLFFLVAPAPAAAKVFSLLIL